MFVCWMSLIWVTLCYPKCHCADCYYDKCHYAECRSATKKSLNSLARRKQTSQQTLIKLFVKLFCHFLVPGASGGIQTLALFGLWVKFLNTVLFGHNQLLKNILGTLARISYSFILLKAITLPQTLFPPLSLSLSLLVPVGGFEPLLSLVYESSFLPLCYLDTTNF